METRANGADACLFDYLLRLGDNALVLAQRLGDLLGAPRPVRRARGGEEQVARHGQAVRRPQP